MQHNFRAILISKGPQFPGKIPVTHKATDFEAKLANFESMKSKDSTNHITTLYDSSTPFSLPHLALLLQVSEGGFQREQLQGFDRE